MATVIEFPTSTDAEGDVQALGSALLSDPRLRPWGGAFGRLRAHKETAHRWWVAGRFLGGEVRPRFTR
jgi:hypothetical protein